MKTATTALKTLLTSGDFVRADLYTFTLSSGTIVRFTSADRVISWSGNTYGIGVKISDGGVKASVGLGANNLTIDLASNPNDTIGATNFFSLLRTNGLDGAKIVVDRVYAPSWAAMASSPTGTINRFSGRFSAITTLSRTGATIEAAPWTELMNVNMPTNVYQPSCLHVLFDTGCGLNRTSFAVSGSVSSGSTVLVLNTGLSQAAGYFTLGKIVFTSGPNNGQVRTVKSHAAGGGLTLVSPLPSAPATGDTFTIYPGCDLSQSTCTSKFSNLSRFRGFPYVPVPEASI